MPTHYKQHKPSSDTAAGIQREAGKPKTTEYTPGPLTVKAYAQIGEQGEWHVVGDDIHGACVATAWGADDTAEANARLISAAPEMLEALISLRKRASIYGGSKGGKMDLAQADAAIAKAVGHE